MPAVESRVEGVWWAKQSAKGTAASTADKQGRKIGGGMSPARDDGNENYSDGSRFSSASDFVNTVLGNGNPMVQGQPGVTGHLAYLMCGQETVTGAADPYTHVATPANGGSFWSTWWKKVGQSSVLRQKFNDCRLTSLRLEASSASKVLHLTATFISLDSGEIFTSDPVKADDGITPLLYTEATGTFTIDGTVYQGHSSFAVTINDNVTPWYGDDVTAYEVVFGQGSVDIEGVTILVDAPGLQRYNTIVYGTASPTAGTKPQKTVPALGSYTFDMTRTGPPAREVKVELPGVKWSPDLSIEGNPDGGAIELPMAGQTRPVTGQPHIRITTKSADPAYT